MKKRRIIWACITIVVALLILLAIVSCQEGNNSSSLERYQNTSFSYFDTVTSITGFAKSEEEFAEISSEIYRALEEYHKLYDIYNSYEGINNLRRINQLHNGEHRVITVDKKIIDMLLYAKEMYAKTNGKINIAMGSVLSIWHEYRSDAIDNNFGVGELPPMEDLMEAAKHTDINNLIIDEEKSTVYLSDPKMTLDVGAIAKGYAVEQVAKMLEEQGIDGFVINVGGNIRTIGKRGDGKFWGAGIEYPDKDSDIPYNAYVGLGGEAIVTSGSYQRYYVVGGEQYHHIIDGETLMPADYFVQVSVICKDSGLGDALSTALFCMPLEEGMAIVEEFEDVYVMWTDAEGKIVKSEGFEKYENQYKK